VVAFAEKFAKDGGRLDYLILNAAVANPQYTQTNDDWETHLEVNHLSNALLTLLLLPQLAKTTENTGGYVRVVIVASGTHTWTDFSKERIPSGKVLATLNDKEFIDKTNAMEVRYPASKCTLSFIFHVSFDPLFLAQC